MQSKLYHKLYIYYLKLTHTFRLDKLVYIHCLVKICLYHNLDTDYYLRQSMLGMFIHKKHTAFNLYFHRISLGIKPSTALGKGIFLNYKKYNYYQKLHYNSSNFGHKSCKYYLRFLGNILQDKQYNMRSQTNIKFLYKKYNLNLMDLCKYYNYSHIKDKYYSEYCYKIRQGKLKDSYSNRKTFQLYNKDINYLRDQNKFSIKKNKLSIHQFKYLHKIHLDKQLDIIKDKDIQSQCKINSLQRFLLNNYRKLFNSLNNISNFNFCKFRLGMCLRMSYSVSRILCYIHYTNYQPGHNIKYM